MMAKANRPISCVIIDSDDHANRTLGMEICKWDEFNLVGQHSCYKEGIQRIQTLLPQVVFLDIGMPFFSGREMLGIMSVRPFKVVFLAKDSSYVHVPIKASRYDCLLKPINLADLRRTLKRLWEGQQRPTPNWPSSVPASSDFVFEKMALPTADGHVFVGANEILYCQADSEYTRIRMLNSTHLICKNLRYFETRLDANRFFRIHRSFLLNLDYIKQVVRTEGGHVIMADNKLVPIGRSRKKEFSLLMGI